MFRGLASFLLVALLGSAGFYAYRVSYQKQALIAHQQAELREKQRVIERLAGSSRLAQAVVTRRWTEDGRVMSAVRFVELDGEGNPISRKDIVVEGETVYFDALVLKFEHGLVGEGDALKGKSLVLFQRLFGEHQQPAEGEPLDVAAPGGVPAGYRTGAEPSPVEVALWEKFWEYADDPEAASAAGVRVAQGEAPYTRMRPGRIYELSVDHAGGLNVQVSPIPAVLMDEDG